MKILLKKCLFIAISFIFWCASKINKKVSEALMFAACYAYEKNSDFFITYSIRPKKTDNVLIKQFRTNSKPLFAIILQGPVREEDDFTYESVKLYKRTCPDAIIILSTWIDTSPDLIVRFERLGVKVVLSNPPSFSGLGNINYQIVSSQAGVKEAKSMGCSYVLKTRSDQRLYRKNLYEYLHGLIRLFPCENSINGLNQKERIVVLQGTSGGVMFVPYFIADFMYFGGIDDIEKLLSIKLEEKNYKEEERQELGRRLKENSSIFEFYQSHAPELRIILNYITHGGKKQIDNSVKEYWKFVKDYLICLSNSDVQMFWPKYEKRFREYEINLDFSPVDKKEVLLTYNWTFSNWLCLYSGEIVYDESCEEIAKSKATNLTF